MRFIKLDGKRMLRRLPAILPILVFICVAVFSCVTAYHYAGNIMDSDMSSELILGKLLASQNRIVTADWYYSSELRFLNTNLVYMPLFKLFSSFHTVRFLSICVMQALMVLSYLYLCRRMKISLKAFFYSASLLILPFNVVYGRLVLYQCYYVPFVVIGFLLVGLFLSVLSHWQLSGKRVYQVLRLILLLALAFASGLNGVRQLTATMAPMLLAAVYLALTQGRKASESLATVRKTQWAGPLLAAGVCAAGAAGYLFQTRVLAQFFTFRTYGREIINSFSFEAVGRIFNGYLEQFGFQPGRVLLSAGGVLAVLGLLAGVYILYANIRNLAPQKDMEDGSKAYFRVFAAAALLWMTAMFIVVEGQDNYVQYYIPAAIWIIPLLAVLMDEAPLKSLRPKRILTALVCVSLFVGGCYTNLYYLNPQQKQVDYDIYIDIHELQQMKGAIAFLDENEYQLGYAFFWNANIITEATDGKIDMIPIEFDSYPDFRYQNWLTVKQYQERAFTEDKRVFMLLSKEQSSALTQTALAGAAALVYSDELYDVYDIGYPTAVWEYLNADRYSGANCPLF